MSDYEIRAYNPEFKKQLLRLQLHFWGDNEARNAAYFEWKYEKNPYIKQPSIALAMCGKEVVGMLGMFGTKWEFGTDPQHSICPCAGDGIVLAAHRRRLLFKKMMASQFQELAGRQYKHCFALSAGTMSYSGLLSTGWKPIGCVGTLHRSPQVHFRRVVRKVQNILRRRSLEPEQGPFRLLDHNREEGRIVVQRCPRPEAMADLVAQQKYSGRIRHVRDATYFAWRFENPFTHYRFFFSGGESLDGYLVLQASAKTQRLAATIVDWEAKSDEIYVALLDAAVNWGQFDELSAWSAMLPANRITVLRHFGFDPIGKRGGNYDSPVLVRPLQNPEIDTNWKLGASPLLTLSSWDLRWLYSDHCR